MLKCFGHVRDIGLFHGNSGGLRERRHDCSGAFAYGFSMHAGAPVYRSEIADILRPNKSLEMQIEYG
jgi:hypothetical protein